MEQEKRSFVKSYFDNKDLEGLKKTIATKWDDKTLEYHLGLIKVPEKARDIVEIGCGIGRLIKALDREDRLFVGIDASEDMIREAVTYLGDTMRRTTLALFDGRGELDILKHDFVFCFTCFQHIPNTDTVLSYIKLAYNSLKERGKFRFQILKEDLHPERELWTFHNPDVLEEYMNKLGFKDITRETHKQWLFIEGTR